MWLHNTEKDWCGHGNTGFFCFCFQGIGERSFFFFYQKICHEWKSWNVMQDCLGKKLITLSFHNNAFGIPLILQFLITYIQCEWNEYLYKKYWDVRKSKNHKNWLLQLGTPIWKHKLSVTFAKLQQGGFCLF